MHELSEVSKELNKNINFHRRWVKLHLLFIVVLSFTVFIVLMLFGAYLMELMKESFSAIVALSNNSTVDLSGIASNVTKISSENNLGYAMVSGFLLLLFISSGLLRYHVKRATINEDRYYHIMKVAILNDAETGLPLIAQQSLLDLRENTSASLSDTEAHAGLAVVEKVLSGLSDSLKNIKK